MNGDKIVDDFNDYCRVLNDCGGINNNVEIVTVYYNPTDYVGKYVARLFLVSAGKVNSTNIIAIGDTFHEIEAKVPHHMTKMNRDPVDDEQILCSYI